MHAEVNASDNALEKNCPMELQTIFFHYIGLSANMHPFRYIVM
jgi:hypothetical protein